MSANEFFFYSIGFAALVFVGVNIFFALQIYLILRTIKKSVKTIKGTVKEAGLIKDTLEFGLLTFVSNLLSKFLGKRG